MTWIALVHCDAFYFFISAQFMDDGTRGPNSRGQRKYRWLTVFELSCLTDKFDHQVGSNVVFDLSKMDLSLREHRLCFISTAMVFQLATMGSYGNRTRAPNRGLHYVFPPSLIRLVTDRSYKTGSFYKTRLNLIRIKIISNVD